MQQNKRVAIPEELFEDYTGNFLTAQRYVGKRKKNK